MNVNNQQQKICRICHDPFTPNIRVGQRQKVCNKISCQRERKRQKQQCWWKENKHLYKDRYEEYLKDWLAQRPGYLKNYRQKKHLEKPADIQGQLTIRKIKTIPDFDIQAELNAIFSERKLSLSYFPEMIYKASQLIVNQVINRE